jgi:hypothetical protein
MKGFLQDSPCGRQRRGGEGRRSVHCLETGGSVGTGKRLSLLAFSFARKRTTSIVSSLVSLCSLEAALCCLPFLSLYSLSLLSLSRSSRSVDIPPSLRSLLPLSSLHPMSSQSALSWPAVGDTFPSTLAVKLACHRAACTSSPCSSHSNETNFSLTRSGWRFRGQDRLRRLEQGRTLLPPPLRLYHRRRSRAWREMPTRNPRFHHETGRGGGGQAQLQSAYLLEQGEEGAEGTGEGVGEEADREAGEARGGRGDGRRFERWPRLRRG